MVFSFFPHIEIFNNGGVDSNRVSFSTAKTSLVLFVLRIFYRKQRVHALQVKLPSHNTDTEMQNHEYLSHNFIFLLRTNSLLLLSSLLVPSPANGDGWGLHRAWFLIFFQNLLESVNWKTIKEAFCKSLIVMLDFSGGLWIIQSMFALTWPKCKSSVLTAICCTTLIQTLTNIQVTEQLHITVYQINQGVAVFSRIYRQKTEPRQKLITYKSS